MLTIGPPLMNRSDIQYDKHTKMNKCTMPGSGLLGPTPISQPGGWCCIQVSSEWATQNGDMQPLYGLTFMDRLWNVFNGQVCDGQS